MAAIPEVMGMQEEHLLSLQSRESGCEVIGEVVRGHWDKLPQFILRGLSK